MKKMLFVMVLFCLFGKMATAEELITLDSGLTPGFVVNDGEFVYYARNNGDYSIKRIDLETGETIFINARKNYYVRRALLRDNYLYWSEGDRGNGYICRMLKTGGSKECPISGNQPNSFAIDDEFIYWGEYNDGTESFTGIRKTPVGGGAIETLTTSGKFYVIAIDTLNIYYSRSTNNNSDHHILSMPKTGDASTVLATVESLVVDMKLQGDTLYWVEYEGRVARMKTDGTDFEVLFTGLIYPSEIDIYGGYLYVTERGEADAYIGRILRKALPDGSFHVLIDNITRPTDISVGPKGVFWMEEITQTSDGSLKWWCPEECGVPMLPYVPEPSGTDESECSGLDPNLPTIVLTHGLQDTDVDPTTDLWTGFGPKQAGRLIEDKLGTSVNICKWVWKGAFQEHAFLGRPTSSAYLLARANTGKAAGDLSDKLINELGDGYNQAIHFIGHSLGVPVSAYAAVLFLNKALNVQDVQFTALDRPHYINKFLLLGESDADIRGYNREFLQKTFALINRPITNLGVENYYSLTQFGVGDIASGLIYNHNNLVDSGKLDSTLGLEETLPDNNHSGVHQWYRWTIDPSLSDNQYPNDPACVNGEFNPNFILASGLDESLNPCEVGWWWSQNSRPEDFPLVTDSSAGGLESKIFDLLGFQGVGCEMVSVPPHTTITCSEEGASTSSASLFASALSSGDTASYTGARVVLLQGASYIRFEYRFSGFEDGDYAAVILDEHPVWLMSASTVKITPEFQDSGLISVGAERGLHYFFISLFGKGSAGAQFEIRNIEFISSYLFKDGFESGDLSNWSTSSVP